MIQMEWQNAGPRLGDRSIPKLIVYLAKHERMLLRDAGELLPIVQAVGRPVEIGGDPATKHPREPVQIL
jgi:hypothetical protein